MPLSKHFGGHGEKVMAAMKKEYGKDAERVFYATENKRKKKGLGPSEHVVKSARKRKK